MHLFQQANHRLAFWQHEDILFADAADRQHYDAVYRRRQANRQRCRFCIADQTGAELLRIISDKTHQHRRNHGFQNHF